MSSCPVALFTNLQMDIVDVYPHLAGPLLPDVLSASSANEAAAIALLHGITKKFEPNGVTDAAKAAAEEVFLRMNARCANWTPTEHPVYRMVLDEMARTANYEVPEVNWGVIFTGGRHGPGASVGSQEHNSAFEKLFLNQVTHTDPALFQEYRRLVSYFPLLSAAEKTRQARFKREKHHRCVRGSTLSVAPKYAHIGRIICTQPSLNMFLQLGLGAVFDGVLLKHYGYDSGKQPDRNRRLAERGSRDGTIATVDLTSASDTVALQACRYVFRRDTIAALEDLRCEQVKVGGQWVELHMLSEMGNGFTFPVQTYFFSLLIKSLARVLGVDWKRYDWPGTPYGVFGDDLIVPQELYAPLLECLCELGFIPNAKKSFSEGPFRESCGTDWFLGVNVRPVYIRSLSTDEDLYSAINRLNRWSATHLIPLKRTIRGLLPCGWRDYIVPLDEDVTAGIQTPIRAAMPVIYQARVPTPETVELYFHVKRLKADYLRSRFNNPFGALISTIEGHVRMGCIERRLASVQYRTELRSTHNWACETDLNGSDCSLASWELMCRVNLYGSFDTVLPADRSSIRTTKAYKKLRLAIVLESNPWLAHKDHL